MNALWIIVALMVGGAGGALAVWAASSDRRKRALEMEREALDAASKLAVAEERVRRADALEKAYAEREAELRGLVAERNAGQVKIAALEMAVEQGKRRDEETRVAIERKDADIRGHIDNDNAKSSRIKELETLLDQERQKSEEKLRLLGEAREKLVVSFKELTSEIMEAKGRAITERNKESLEALLKPLGDKIRDFERKVVEGREQSVKDGAGLREQLSRLRELNERLSQDAINLTKALKGQTKTQGNWGELVLERILEVSGLRKGEEYVVQESFTDEEGRRQIPDVLIKLPNSKNVIIDSKVSLTSYERYCSAEDDATREQALKAHALSMRNHIKMLSEKNYQCLLEARSLDFVFMFVPVEPAYGAALSYDDQLTYEAYSRNVAIVTPSTLLATLRAIAYIWRDEKQNRNALEIARQSGLLYDRLKSFVENLDKIGAQLDAARATYERVRGQLSTGKGNLIRRAERIKALGAQTSRSLGEGLVEEADQGDDDDASSEA